VKTTDKHPTKNGCCCSWDTPTHIATPCSDCLIHGTGTYKSAKPLDESGEKDKQ